MKRFLGHGLLAVLLAAAAPAWASFVENNDGTVSDTATGLTWAKCSSGQGWATTGGPGTCTGAAGAYTWQEALQAASAANAAQQAGKTDWRLPNHTELESLVRIDAYDPAVDTAAFPATPADLYWASTSVADPAGYAWYVDFKSGETLPDLKTKAFRVRLVRGGAASAGFDSLAVTYAIAVSASPSAGGTVACAPNPVSADGASTCTATPSAGYDFVGWSGDCSGNGACSLTDVAAAKRVTAGFEQQWSGLTLPQGAQAGEPLGLALQPGQGWQITQASTITAASLGVALPAGLALPQGLLKLRLEHGAPGSAAAVVLTYPQPLPEGATYYKFGRTADNAAPHWYPLAGAVISGNTITLALTDGGAGDDDGAVNGVIDDPGGPAVRTLGGGGSTPASGATPVPTLGQWALVLLAALLAAIGVGRVRRTAQR